jgi:hypothetical protein
LTNPKGDMSCFSQSVSMTKRNYIVLLKNKKINNLGRIIKKKGDDAIESLYSDPKTLTFYDRQYQ